MLTYSLPTSYWIFNFWNNPCLLNSVPAATNFTDHRAQFTDLPSQTTTSPLSADSKASSDSHHKTTFINWMMSWTRLQGWLLTDSTYHKTIKEVSAFPIFWFLSTLFQMYILFVPSPQMILNMCTALSSFWPNFLQFKNSFQFPASLNKKVLLYNMMQLMKKG